MDELTRRDLEEVKKSIMKSWNKDIMEIGVRHLVRSAQKYWNGERETLMWGRYEVYFCEDNGLVERIIDKAYGEDIYSRKDELIKKVAGI